MWVTINSEIIHICANLFSLIGKDKQVTKDTVLEMNEDFFKSMFKSMFGDILCHHYSQMFLMIVNSFLDVSTGILDHYSFAAISTSLKLEG